MSVCSRQRGWCDSFVVETDVHHPTDVSLWWDSLRSVLRCMRDTQEGDGVCDWWQMKHGLPSLYRLFGP